MRYRTRSAAYLAAGIAQVAGVLLIVHYARAQDDYYTPTHVTHWEHAAKDSGANWAVGALVLASMIAVAFLLQGLFPSRSIVRPLQVVAGAAYVVALFGAYFFLTVGH